ncbi:DUF1788 domain-containing protein [Bifidobacterium sp. 82T24]|uniref:DUF1788 domain-containing protein n=1 Tax=Bifidobacterium pluvialisilvae TaxID=2834436 RepID=UPI001C56A58A|nr:DUF1788 domain-containing protein [Bifidobacterium pluvialisilvae]MBW3088266.1 DUF1788 domain-containing protein [Bifidobacterium pluvialisilvae]
MAVSNTVQRDPRDIEHEFDSLFAIMRKRSFRDGSDTAGEPANYIYAYPPDRELEVGRRIAQLTNRLQGMTPDPGDIAPGVLVIDLYDTAIGVLRDSRIFDRVLKKEPRLHRASPDGEVGDMFLQSLVDKLSPDKDDLMNAIAERYREARERHQADIVFITGVGRVYPYIRTHTLMERIQLVFEQSRPVVLFFPGTYAKTASMVSTMRLFDRLGADNYYRSFSLNGMEDPLGGQ